MGDVQTHGSIARRIIDELRTARPSEDYIYFEIGNWLTDMSQFRDPTAYIGAKLKIWNIAKTQGGAAGCPFALDVVAKFDNYLDELFGKPGQHGGKMGEYWRHLVFAITLEAFRNLSPTIDPDEVERIYDESFTQYYPHEHLDFPPPDEGTVGLRPPSEILRHRCGSGAVEGPEQRKILTYLERQIVWVSHLYSLIERDWAQTAPTPDTLHRRHQILARFGHASHAVEDFFFHSNFLEIGWQHRGLTLPTLAAFTFDTPHEGSTPPNDFNATRMQRLFDRRRRAPTKQALNADGDDVSTAGSEPATHLYTGFFGGDDVSHTLTDALEGLVRMRDRARTDPRAIGAGALGLDGTISSLSHVIDGIERAFVTDEAEQQRILRQHRQDLDDGTAYRELEAKLRAPPPNNIHQKTYDHLRAAYDLDKDLGHKYSWVSDGQSNLLGIYGMIQKLGKMTHEEHDASVRRSREFDGVPSSDSRFERIQNASRNGASGETIGSHSLMAKDSTRKQPLREQAIRVATRAAVYLGQQMAARVSAAPAGGASPTEGLDWLHALRHFLAHPEEAEGDSSGPWWQAIANDETLFATGNVFHTPATVTGDELASRALERTKPELEQLYTHLEQVFENRYRSAVNSKFIGDSAIWGLIFGLIGGIVGSSVGIATTERQPNDGEKAGAIIGFTLLAGAVGAGLTAFFTFLGSLIGDGGTGSGVFAIIALFALTLGGGFAATFASARAVGSPRP